MVATNNKIRLAVVTAIVAASYLPAQSLASGFALIENNAKGQGNAYAGAAAYAQDASTVYFNPAGMMQLEGDQMSIALHYIDPEAKFSDNGSVSAFAAPLTGPDDDGGKAAVVPNLYLVKSIGQDVKFGLGFSTTFGLETDYDNTWKGRYHAVTSDLKTFNVNPSMAFKLSDKVSLGGGFNILMGDITLSQTVDFGAICQAFEGAGAFPGGTCAGAGATSQAADGFAELTGDNFSDPAVGFNLGLTYKINDHSNLGVSYRSEIDLEVTGDVDFTVPANATFFAGATAPTGLFLDGGLKAGVTLPASMSFSYANTSGKITYLADMTWTGWSSFDELRIVYDNNTQANSVTTEKWQDTMRYSLGFDYQLSDATTLRAGIALDETPIRNAELRTPRIPGNDRNWFSVGMSHKFDEKSSIDVGLSHLKIDDTEIDHVLESSVPTLAANLKGTYEASVNILSVQYNWHID